MGTNGKKARKSGDTRAAVKRDTMRSRNARARERGKTYKTCRTNEEER